MRIATYNIGGAKIAGRRSAEQQARSWHWLAANGIDLAFVQETQHAVIPEWVEDRWTVVRGQLGELGKTGDWGSAIVARFSLQLQDRDDLVAADPWLSLLHDYVVVGEIRLPDGAPAIVASVHAVAKDLSRSLAENVPPGAEALFSEIDLQRIVQPTDVPWVLDVVFHALARTVKGHRFVVGGLEQRPTVRRGTRRRADRDHVLSPARRRAVGSSPTRDPRNGHGCAPTTGLCSLTTSSPTR